VKYFIEVSGYIYAPVASLRKPVHEIGVGSKPRIDMVMEKQKVTLPVRTQSFLIELTRQLYKVDSCITTIPRRRIKGVEINS